MPVVYRVPIGDAPELEKKIKKNSQRAASNRGSAIHPSTRGDSILLDYQGIFLAA